MSFDNIVMKGKTFNYFNEHTLFHIYTQIVQHPKIHNANITDEKRTPPNNKQNRSSMILSHLVGIHISTKV